MEEKQISPLEVIRAYYISQELLHEIFNENPKKTKTQSHKSLDATMREIIQKAEKLSKNKLLSYPLDNWHPRYDNYMNSTWTLKEIPLDECGAWPRMGGLPEEATHGSVLDTVEYIKPYLKDKNRLTLKTSRILYIEEMMKYAEKILEYIPIIVLEDHVIRHKKTNKPSERKSHKKTKYDIDDGNHRAIAYGLLGKTKIKALVGKRIYKSKLLYI